MYYLIAADEIERIQKRYKEDGGQTAANRNREDDNPVHGTEGVHLRGGSQHQDGWHKGHHHGERCRYDSHWPENIDKVLLSCYFKHKFREFQL